MDPKSPNQKRLDDLPRSESNFWDGEVNTNIVPKKIKFMDEPHIFVRTTGREAQCIHCDWGFELDPGDKIIEGHLYNAKGKKVL